ncbi:MAG: glutamine synthetase type III, partial [Oscillospiraceae bacterium]
RGLCNFVSTADCLPHLTDEKNIDLFERHGVYSQKELRARRDILLENYCKQVNIEAHVMVEMARRDILPAVIGFEKQLADAVLAKRAVSKDISSKTETRLLEWTSRLSDLLSENCQKLENSVSRVDLKNGDLAETASYCHQAVLADMSALRGIADELETIVSKDAWPYPSYGRLLYRV